MGRFGELLDEKELSEDLGDVSLSTLRYWRHVGEGPPFIKLGRKVRYRVEDVRRWLDESQVEPQDKRRVKARRSG